jgi:hypothetical protein
MSVSVEVETDDKPSVLNEKLIFGITVDGVDDAEVDVIIDDIYDQLDDDGFDQDEWDMIVWLRGETCYIVMFAPLLTRASLLKISGIDRLRPLSHTAKSLMDNRNTWFLPILKRNDTMTAAERAADTLSGWQEAQYAVSGGSEYVVDDGADIEVARASEVSDTPLPRRKKKAEVKVASASELMQILNLDGATDTEGKKFVFGDDD